jgi:hypothetical protein
MLRGFCHAKPRHFSAKMRVLGQRDASIPYAQPSTHPRQPEKLVFLPVRLAIESSYTEPVEAERRRFRLFWALFESL